MAKTFLIVDDSNAIRQSVSFILEEAGYQVTQAADGVEAAKKLEGHSFDLILSDMNRPNMDGIALTAHIRQAVGHEFTPLLMLTTEAQSKMMQAGKEAGAVMVMSAARVTAVQHVLEYFASGMTEAEVLEDFPYITHQDIPGQGTAHRKKKGFRPTA